jgi:hypothetical protein
MRISSFDPKIKLSPRTFNIIASVTVKVSVTLRVALRGGVVEIMVGTGDRDRERGSSMLVIETARIVATR